MSDFALIDAKLDVLLERTGPPKRFLSIRSAAEYSDLSQESLRRMAGTVESLKRVRRIVLTDYISGTKMLDLPRSIAGDMDADAADASDQNPSAHPATDTDTPRSSTPA